MNPDEPQTLHVLFTMDCAPPDGPDPVPGPASWDEALRSMSNFAEGLAAEELLGTFFLAPECLKRLKDEAEQLRAGGMELGLLCHPQLSSYQSYLGSYGFDRQREVVHLEKTVWEDVLGAPAEAFRAGYFSANDFTYHVLCMEGFRQTSCSLPGRVDPDQCSMWQNVYPFAHHTDPLDRLIEGTMELFEVPVTSDFAAKEFAKAETYTPPHLRIEEPCFNDFAEGLVRKLIERMQEDQTGERTVTLVTSNCVSWGGKEDPHRERLSNVASLLRRIAEESHMRFAPATLASVHQEADADLGPPPEPETSEDT